MEKLKRIIPFALIFLFTSVLGHSQTNTPINRISNYLDELSTDDFFSLSIAISQGDEVVFKNAYGYANRSHKFPNKVTTKYNIASIGKMFTAVATLQLYEKNKIDLHQPVGKYLPEFPNEYIRDSITIHQLLTHTGGLPIWFSRDFVMNPKFSFLSLSDYLPLFDNITIDRQKIGQNSYSNVGYFVLGYIIENISGKSYKEYVNAHLFHPLKMKNTDLWNLTEIIPVVATGYIRPANKNDWWKTNAHINMGSGPAGGAYSSVLDFLTFFKALRNNELLSPENTALMFSPKTQTDDGQYGYGISISENNGQKIIGHLGGFFGIRGELMWYKKGDYTVAILANSDHTDYIDISYFIKTELTGTKNQQEIYNNTLSLIKQINKKDFQVTEANCKKIMHQKFDESLIQIKAYHFLNNKNYEHAALLFKLNSILFPDSESAKNDLAKANKLME